MVARVLYMQNAWRFPGHFVCKGTKHGHLSLLHFRFDFGDLTSPSGGTGSQFLH